MYSLALLIESKRSYPKAKLAAIAEEKVQPVP
jgi:hypothetical protein